MHDSKLRPTAVPRRVRSARAAVGPTVGRAVMCLAVLWLALPPLVLLLQAAVGDPAGMGTAGDAHPTAAERGRWAAAAARTLALGAGVGLATVAAATSALVGLLMVAPHGVQRVLGWGVLAYAIPAPGLALALLHQYVGEAPQPWPRWLLMGMALTALHLPLALRLLAGALHGQPWRAWIDASRLLGASDWRCAWTVLLPPLRKAQAATAALCLLAAATELSLATLLLDADGLTLQPLFNAMRTASLSDTAWATTITLGLCAVVLAWIPMDEPADAHR